MAEKTEMMQIVYRRHRGSRTVEVPVGITLGQAAEYCYDFSDGYRPVLGEVDGEYCDLLKVLDEPCTVSFLDMRSRTARLSYQRTAHFIYLTALNLEYPMLTAELLFPLNGGNYIRIEDMEDQPEDMVVQIDKRMREIISSGEVISAKVLRRETLMSDEAKNWLRDDQIRYVRGCSIEKVYVYTLKGYSEVFYEPILTDVSAIDIFELIPYEGGAILRVPSFECDNALPPYRDDRKLFESFSRTKKWNESLLINNMADLNRKIENGEWRDLVLISDAVQEKVIGMIADDIVSRNRRIILIAGPSSSGKTTFAQRLCIQLRVNGKRPLYMGTDDYFKERSETPKDEEGNYDFESLEAIDVDLFDRNLNDLMEGKEVDLPVFDFISGSKRFGERITSAEEDQPVVIEGIHGLNRELTRQIDEALIYRIYISPLMPLNIDTNNRTPVTDIRLLRRMARDTRSRGKDARQTLAEWYDVRRGEVRNIFPFNGTADVVFNSAFLYELAALKPLVMPGLRSIGDDDITYPEARRLIRLLNCVNELEDLDILGNNSILREFLGGALWVK